MLFGETASVDGLRVIAMVVWDIRTCLIPPAPGAVHHDQTACVDALLRHGADINLRASDGSTALHEAAYFGSKEMIARLVSAGADVNARDATGRASLHWSTDNPSTDVRACVRGCSQRGRQGREQSDVSVTRGTRRSTNLYDSCCTPHSRCGPLSCSA